MKNLALLLLSFIASLLLCEVGLRSFTAFPITEDSNKAPDPVLGYRLSTRLDDVDESGFRNPEQTGNYRIAAIGDSHTYGVNVSSDMSWPSQLGRKSGEIVYNFGVGSYGILNYHAIVKTLIDPAAEAVIIGLYPANDFERKKAFCKINTGDNSFWEHEFRNLGIELPSPAFSIRQCRDAGPLARSKDFIGENSALFSAVKILVVDRLQAQLRGSGIGGADYYYFANEQIHPVARARTRGHAQETDLDNPDALSMFNNLGLLAKSWKEWSRQTNTGIGILIIPSMERVIYEYFAVNGTLDVLDEDFVRDLQVQVRFENRLAGLFDDLDIPHQNALNHAVQKFAKSLQQGSYFYPPDNGHPLEAGYAAYAESAIELWKVMRRSRDDQLSVSH